MLQKVKGAKKIAIRLLQCEHLDMIMLSPERLSLYIHIEKILLHIQKFTRFGTNYIAYNLNSLQLKDHRVFSYACCINNLCY